MGFWGPTVNVRIVGNKEEWYGKCDTCKEPYEGKSKSRVESAINACEKRHKKEKREQERNRAAYRQKIADEKHQQRKEKRANQEAQKRAEEAKRLKGLMAHKMRERRRLAKGKCPFCGKQPCAGRNEKCYKVQAVHLESSMNMDMSDPGTFDAQLRWYRDNM